MAQPSSNVHYSPITGQHGLPQDDYGFHAPQPQYYDAPSAMQSTTSFSPSFRPPDSVQGLNRDSQFSAFQAYRDDPRDSSISNLPMNNMGSTRPPMTEKRAMYAPPREQNKKRLTLIIVAVVVLLLIAAAIGLPLYFAVIRPKTLAASNNNNHNSSNNDSSENTGNDNNVKPHNLITWGPDGSSVEMEDGTKFTYNNKFGGYWVFDPANPTNNSARAQSFSPPLDQEFKYGVDQIRGCVDAFPCTSPGRSR